MGNGVTTDSLKLTKAQKKDIKEAKKAEQERLEAQKKAEAEALAIKLSGQSDATKKGGVRSDVKDDLKEMYKNGEIDKAVYKEAKSYSGSGSLFSKIFGKKKDSTIAFAAEARENKFEKAQEQGFDFSKKSEKMLDSANLTNDDLTAIAKRNIGSDGIANYSFKKRQSGEVDAIQAELNQNSGDVQFSKSRTKKLLKQMDVDVEKTVRPGKVIAGATIGAAAAAPFGFIKMSQSVNPDATGVIVGTVNQTMKIGGFAPAIGAAVGAGVAIGKEITRVEKKVAETDLPTTVKTYDEYQKYNDTYSTKKGAEIMNKIGKFYVGDDGKTLNKEKIEKDLQQAAGDGSVLNYEEAVSLHADLVKGKAEPVAVAETTPTEPSTPVVPQKETCEVKLTEDKKEVVKEESTAAYKVQKGEYWYSIAAAKYPNASAQELKQIVRILKEKHCPEGMKSTDAFQPKVMYLPETITVGEKSFNLNINGVVQNKNAGPSNVKTTNVVTNPFTKTVEETSYGYDGCESSAKGLSKEARDAQIEAYKKAHPEKEVIVK